MSTGGQSDSSGAGSSSFGQAQNQDQALAKINRDMQEKAARLRAKDSGLEYVDVGAFPINPDILKVIPVEEARNAIAVPFYRSGTTLKLAVYDPTRQETQTLVERIRVAGYEVQIFIASQDGIFEAAELYKSNQLRKPTEEKSNVIDTSERIYQAELKDFDKLIEQIKLMSAEEGLNALNVAAIKAGASDMHFQPEENDATLRFRIDGVLYSVVAFDKELYERLINQLKYKAKLKLNIKNEPQDGRFYFIVNDKKIDVRVASIPTEYGESIVCRILDTNKNFGSFDRLGFSNHALERLQRAARLSQGMILTTGPTSSGKSTTLYVMLNELNTSERKIITLEDPVEYHMRGITQSQVNEKRGYTFSGGLRSILRHDPDAVMIGEIRDKETAEVATQAALAGHLMLSTLHANNAVDAIPRLITMGVPSFMIAPALSLIIAQRLVRRLCECAVEKPITEAEKKFIEDTIVGLKSVPNAPEMIVPTVFKQPNGCDKCVKTGYRGVSTIAEALWLEDSMREVILHNGSSAEIYKLAREFGMVTMAEDGVLKVIEGITTLQEIHRVTNA